MYFGYVGSQLSLQACSLWGMLMEWVKHGDVQLLLYAGLEGQSGRKPMCGSVEPSRFVCVFRLACTLFCKGLSLSYMQFCITESLGSRS